MDLARLFGAGTKGNMPESGLDKPTMDTAEIVHISSLALLKVHFCPAFDLEWDD